MGIALNAYYLQEMGIQTWVRRGIEVEAAVCELDILPSQHASPILMIFIEKLEAMQLHQWVLSKAGRLLMKMLHSIGLSQENTLFIGGGATDSIEAIHHRDALLKEQVGRYHPKLILRLGSFSSEMYQSTYNSLPIISSSHPEDLLINPMKKKQVFTDLMLVKSRLDN
jgi:hypothetical protein